MPSFANDLWNQIAGLPKDFASFPDQEFDDGLFDSFDTYLANDVVVGPSGWIVDSVTVQVEASMPAAISNIHTAKLNVFQNPGGETTPKTTDNPVNGTVVSVIVTPVAGNSSGFFITASGLNLGLGGGEYWIDLTPIGGIAAAGESLEDYSPNNAAGALLGTAARNTGGGYAFPTGTDWGTLQNENKNVSPQYGAIDIQGALAPEPATFVLVGAGFAALLVKKRLTKATELTE